MISTLQPTHEKAKPGVDLKIIDQSEDLINQCGGPDGGGRVVLDLVHAAMKAGLTTFSTPTPENGEGYIDWKVRTWVVNRGGEPKFFRVAQKENFEHFMIFGPEVETETKKQEVTNGQSGQQNGPNGPKKP